MLLHIGLGILLYLAFQNWWTVGVALLTLGALYTLVPLFIIRRLCAEKKLDAVLQGRQACRAGNEKIRKFFHVGAWRQVATTP